MALPMGQKAEDCVTSYKQSEQRPPRQESKANEREEEAGGGWPLRNITTLSEGGRRASEGGESLMGRL